VQVRTRVHGFEGSRFPSLVYESGWVPTGEMQGTKNKAPGFFDSLWRTLLRKRSKNSIRRNLWS
jgi:hypothetical protein